MHKEDLEELTYKYINYKRLNKQQRTDIYKLLLAEIANEGISESRYKIIKERNSCDIIIDLEAVTEKTLYLLLEIAGYLAP